MDSSSPTIPPKGLSKKTLHGPDQSKIGPFQDSHCSSSRLQYSKKNKKESFESKKSNSVMLDDFELISDDESEKLNSRTTSSQSPIFFSKEKRFSSSSLISKSKKKSQHQSAENDQFDGIRNWVNEYHIEDESKTFSFPLQNSNSNSGIECCSKFDYYDNGISDTNCDEQLTCQQPKATLGPNFHNSSQEFQQKHTPNGVQSKSNDKREKKFLQENDCLFLSDSECEVDSSNHQVPSGSNYNHSNQEFENKDTFKVVISKNNDDENEVLLLHENVCLTLTDSECDADNSNHQAPSGSNCNYNNQEFKKKHTFKGVISENRVESEIQLLQEVCFIFSDSECDAVSNDNQVPSGSNCNYNKHEFKKKHSFKGVISENKDESEIQLLQEEVCFILSDSECDAERNNHQVPSGSNCISIYNSQEFKKKRSYKRVISKHNDDDSEIQLLEERVCLISSDSECDAVSNDNQVPSGSNCNYNKHEFKKKHSFKGVISENKDESEIQLLQEEVCFILSDSECDAEKNNHQVPSGSNCISIYNSQEFKKKRSYKRVISKHNDDDSEIQLLEERVCLISSDSECDAVSNDNQVPSGSNCNYNKHEFKKKHSFKEVISENKDESEIQLLQEEVCFILSDSECDAERNNHQVLSGSNCISIYNSQEFKKKRTYKRVISKHNDDNSEIQLLEERVCLISSDSECDAERNNHQVLSGSNCISIYNSQEFKKKRTYKRVISKHNDDNSEIQLLEERVCLISSDSECDADSNDDQFPSGSNCNYNSQEFKNKHTFKGVISQTDDGDDSEIQLLQEKVCLILSESESDEGSSDRSQPSSIVKKSNLISCSKSGKDSLELLYGSKSVYDQSQSSLVNKKTDLIPRKSSEDFLNLSLLSCNDDGGRASPQSDESIISVNSVDRILSNLYGNTWNKESVLSPIALKRKTGTGKPSFEEDSQSIQATLTQLYGRNWNAEKVLTPLSIENDVTKGKENTFPVNKKQVNVLKPFTTAKKHVPINGVTTRIYSSRKGPLKHSVL